MKGGKRRNRAPPPPPGVSKRKGGGKSGAVGHKVGAKEGEEGRRGKGGREEEENERVTMAEGSTRVGENEEVTEVSSYGITVVYILPLTLHTLNHSMTTRPFQGQTI